MWAAIKITAKNADARALYARLGGRSFLVVSFFAVTGFWLEAHGKLTADYAALATALSGFHIFRSAVADKFSSSGQ